MLPVFKNASRKQQLAYLQKRKVWKKITFTVQLFFSEQIFGFFPLQNKFLTNKRKKQVFLSFLNNHLSGIFLDMCSKKVKKKKQKLFSVHF